MTSIRVATLNLWGASGDWRRRMGWAAKQVHEQGCDAVLVQEVSQSAALLAAELGMALSLSHSSNSDYGLGIMSRLEVGELRHTQLPAPQGEERRLLSVHLPSANTWLHCTHLSHELSASAWRQKQVLRIAEVVAELGEGPLHVLGGDMNAAPESEEMQFLRGLCSIDDKNTKWQDAWLERHPEDERGHTWCMQTGEERSRRSNPNDRRIDYLFVSPRREGRRGEVLVSSKVCEAADESGMHASDHCGLWARIDLGA